MNNDLLSVLKRIKIAHQFNAHIKYQPPDVYYNWAKNWWFRSHSKMQLQMFCRRYFSYDSFFSFHLILNSQLRMLNQSTRIKAFSSLVLCAVNKLNNCDLESRSRFLTYTFLDILIKPRGQWTLDIHVFQRPFHLIFQMVLVMQQQHFKCSRLYSKSQT